MSAYEDASQLPTDIPKPYAIARMKLDDLLESLRAWKVPFSADSLEMELRTLLARKVIPFCAPGAQTMEGVRSLAKRVLYFVQPVGLCFGLLFLGLVWVSLRVSLKLSFHSIKFVMPEQSS